jgi:hypothetical protein
LLINVAALAFAQAKQIQGSGGFVTLPGRNVSERQVMNMDIARANPGDYFWRRVGPNNSGRIEYTDPRTGETWGWLYINRGDINYARDRDIMNGFTPTGPGVDEDGEAFMEYGKTEDHSRRLYDSGKIEDVITRNAEFDAALTEFRKVYSQPVPRRNAAITGATNWYYTNDVPDNFPTIFWASIKLEGRYMQVIIANGNYRLAVSYWATEGFLREQPNAAWSWAGVDAPHGSGARMIQEDLSQTAATLEYFN